MSFVEQTYGAKGGMKILKNLQKPQQYDLIDKIKTKVFNRETKDFIFDKDETLKPRTEQMLLPLDFEAVQFREVTKRNLGIITEV